MRVIRDQEDIDIIKKHKLGYFRRQFDTTIIPHSEFLKLTDDELEEMMESGTYLYEDDIHGDRTLILKQFSSIQEAEDWVRSIDIELYAQELRDQYGKCSAQIDLQALQFTVTKYKQL